MFLLGKPLTHVVRFVPTTFCYEIKPCCVKTSLVKSPVPHTNVHITKEVHSLSILTYHICITRASTPLRHFIAFIHLKLFFIKQLLGQGLLVGRAVVSIVEVESDTKLEPAKVGLLVKVHAMVTL